LAVTSPDAMALLAGARLKGRRGPGNDPRRVILRTRDLPNETVSYLTISTGQGARCMMRSALLPTMRS
jgi:hypothetical protein